MRHPPPAERKRQPLSGRCAARARASPSRAPTGGDVSTDMTITRKRRGFGWLFFSGTVLGLAGLMRIVDSIWAFRYNGALPGQPAGRDVRRQSHDVRLGVAPRRHPADRFQLHALDTVAVRSLGRVDHGSDHGAERDHVDALLPDLGADLRRDRRARVLRFRRPRRPHALHRSDYRSTPTRCGGSSICASML